MKTLKITLALLLACCMLLSLAACKTEEKIIGSDSIETEAPTSEPTETQPVGEHPSGTYVSYKVEFGGESQDTNGDSGILFHDDGTGELLSYNGSEPMTWNETVIVDASGFEMPYLFVDGEITIEIDGVKAYFCEGVFEVPDELPTEHEEHIHEWPETDNGEQPSGTYELYQGKLGEDIMTAEEIGLTMVITFREDGTGEIDDGMKTYAMTWSEGQIIDELGGYLHYICTDSGIVAEYAGAYLYYRPV